MSAVLGAATQVMKITTPTLGANKLLALRVDGREALSRLSEYTVDCVGNASLLTGRVKVDLHAMLGTRINVSIDVAGNKRYIDGYVIRALRGERHGRFDRYNLVLRPWLWFATRTKNSRVFQDKTVKEIIQTVLDTYSSDYDWDLQGELPKLEYCVQYDETDFDFVSRLMEEFGVYYFFKHSDSDHTLVLVDAMNKHPKRASSGPLTWSNKLDGNSRLTGWHTLEEVRSTKAVVRDYDYLASGTEIEAKDSGAQSATTAVLGDAEIYEFPARAVQNQVAAKSKSAAKAADEVAKRLVEAAQSMQKLHSGECNAHDMTAGVTFKLTNAPRSEEDAEYLVVACEFSAEYGDQEAIADLKTIKQRRDGFIGSIQAIHATKGLYRHERSTPRPRMHGPQIATVVGGSSNEIETDVNGRIKIQFPWDREGKKNQDSSCWVRVAQPWAGDKMGLWMLPRVGHEVVVSFIGGDPDRPIVTGSVHNDANPPPYKLPAHADVATWISHSTKGGAADANNELRFCDTKDKEHLWLQAQKAFYRHVKGDTFDHLEMNETRKVKQTVKEVIGHNWYLNVGEDVMHDLGKDLHTKVAGDIFTTGAATWQISLAKDYGLKIGADMGVDVTGKTALKSGGDVNVTTNGAMNLKSTGNLVGEATGKVSMKSAADVLLQGMNIKAKGTTEIVLEASMGIKIVCGASVITLGPAGVTIDGPLVKVNCGGGGGSAGAAESAASAEPKAVAEAIVQDQLKNEKAEDYDKLLADPIAPVTETTASAPAVAAPDIPDIAVPVLPSVPDVFVSDAALGAAAAAAALAAMAASAAAAVVQDALTPAPPPPSHSDAAEQSVLDASAAAQQDTRQAEAAGKDPDAKTQEQVQQDSAASETEARQAEEAGKDPDAKTEEQVQQDSAAAETEARQAEDAGKDADAKTEEQVQQDSSANEAAARSAEDAAAADSAAAADKGADGSEGGGGSA